MSNRKDKDKQDGEPVVDLEKSRERLQATRQDRAAAQLAARFHDAMGWPGKPPKSRDGKKTKRKKR